jgi:hypothetical protein
MNHLLHRSRLAVLIALTVILAACASTSVNHSEMIMGKWDTEIQGFPLTLAFSGTEIEIIGMGQSIPYTMAGDMIAFDFQGPQSARVAFPAENQMTQTNMATEEVQMFTRNAE